MKVSDVLFQGEKKRRRKKKLSPDIVWAISLIDKKKKRRSNSKMKSIHSTKPMKQVRKKTHSHTLLPKSSFLREREKEERKKN